MWICIKIGDQKDFGLEQQFVMTKVNSDLICDTISFNDSL